ncbi:MAG TPA: F0F1 ATP synthase subunit delta [Candidatus Acidoferrales bacterium]|nr:F0F1 ATP synthase subunit delta [Candidatus Acidoferrales bacterium]
MGFSWSTFLVQILNFIVLVWILTRFLYRPVMRAIAERQQTIAQELRRADEVKKQSEALSKQYRDRLADWEAEKTQLKTALDTELGTERAKREAELRAALQREREQAEAAARVRERESRRKLEREAARDAALFCARFLARFASPDIEREIVEAAIADIRSLSGDQRATLVQPSDGPGQVVVTTRYPLDEAHRSGLTDALTQCLGHAPNPRFELSDALVAGLRVDLGTTTLEGNIAGELQWFARVTGA